MSNEPVYTVTLEITQKDVEEIIDTLNDCEFDDEDDVKMTYEEVMENPELLKYLMDLDYKALMFADLSEFWNSDGWCDVADYRK